MDPIATGVPGVSCETAELCSPDALTVMRISLPPGRAETEKG